MWRRGFALWPQQWDEGPALLKLRKQSSCADAEQRKHSSIAGTNVNGATAENNLAVPYEVKYMLPITQQADPVISPRDMETYTYTKFLVSNVYSS